MVNDGNVCEEKIEHDVCQFEICFKYHSEKKNVLYKQPNSAR